MGNYDIPIAPVPVFTKPCGCVMKLTAAGNSRSSHNSSQNSSLNSSLNSSHDNNSSKEAEMTWTCVRWDLDPISS
jgi:hypothetical protein